jgi:hypothetical protein
VVLQMPANDLRFCFAAAVNDEQILAGNLRRSAAIRNGIPLVVIQGAPAAAIAYNQVLRDCVADVVVFAHQDVYLPQGWLQTVRNAIGAIARSDPDWAVIGVFGVTSKGDYVGHLWSSGLYKEIICPLCGPTPVESIDELVIILRTAAGIRFDERLPGFHLYGTDIVQTALAAGKGAYVIDAPVIHNSRPVRTLLGAYFKAARFIAKKWRRSLPLHTPCSKITRHLMTFFLSECKSSLLKRRVRPGRRSEALDAVKQSKKLGYE